MYLNGLNKPLDGIHAANPREALRGFGILRSRTTRSILPPDPFCMSRRTKIVCTLGPATDDLATIRQLIRAGMDVARLNFSHGTHAWHAKLIERVRKASELEGRQIAILQDLQGPKLRVGNVAGGEVTLVKGRKVVITPEPMAESTAQRLYVSYPTLAQDVEIGGEILLDDGNLELEVIEKKGLEVITKVRVGGPLRSRKGVNLPHIQTTTPALTEKDLKDLAFGLEHKVDIIALSFVRKPSDVQQLVDRIRKAKGSAMVVAKIEKPEALDCIDEIIDIADAVMVARGDLGIEMRLSKVPFAQKRIIKACLENAKPVITATQMLESMIENPRPTRAEVSDVANAVLDGSDAVMLSGETAMGANPIRAVEVMATVIAEAERAFTENDVDPTPVLDAPSTTEAVSRTAFFLAHKVGAKAIACLTASGATARSIARHRPHVPLYAFTGDRRILGHLALSWGTKGFYLPFQTDTDRGIELVHKLLVKEGLALPGDLIVVTAGMPLPAKGRTNMVHVSQIPG
jgi:pyruvate kinase